MNYKLVTVVGIEVIDLKDFDFCWVCAAAPGLEGSCGVVGRSSSPAAQFYKRMVNMNGNTKK